MRLLPKAGTKRYQGQKGNGMPVGGRRREILFEMHRAGNTVRVTAIDPETGIEAAAIGPATAGEAALQALAVKKLDYVLGKKKRAGEGGGTG